MSWGTLPVPDALGRDAAAGYPSRTTQGGQQKCDRCGHVEDVHRRYVRNLNCCYDCRCTRFMAPLM